MGTGQFTQITLATHVHKESQHASRKQQKTQKRAHTRRKAHCIAGALAHKRVASHVATEEGGQQVEQAKRRATRHTRHARYIYRTRGAQATYSPGPET